LDNLVFLILPILYEKAIKSAVNIPLSIVGPGRRAPSTFSNIMLTEFGWSHFSITAINEGRDSNHCQESPHCANVDLSNQNHS
jgi:hypothetical protein